MNKEFEEALEFVKTLLEENRKSMEVCLRNNYKCDWLKTKKTQLLNLQQALSIVGEHLKFEDGGTAIIKDFLTGKEETKHIIKVKSKDTDATINILLDMKEFDTFKEIE